MRFYNLLPVVMARNLAARPPTGEIVKGRPYEPYNIDYIFETFQYGPSLESIDLEMRPTDESYVYFVKWCKWPVATENIVDNLQSAVQIKLFNPTNQEVKTLAT